MHLATHSCIRLGSILFVSYICDIFLYLFGLTDQMKWDECSCEYQEVIGKVSQEDLSGYSLMY